MNYKNRIRTLAMILLLALLGTSATAASLNSLFKYAQSQGFKVKTKATRTKQATIAYAESSNGSDKLTWTDTNRKSYTITASTTDKKNDLRELCVYLVNHYKWHSGSYKVNGVVMYGYNVKKAKNNYKTIALFRKAIKKHVKAEPEPKGNQYVLNTSTMKFHYPSCKDVPRIKAENRKDVTTTRDELISEGYSPCGHCKP